MTPVARRLLKHACFVLICLLPFAYLAHLYPQLPEVVPTHFDSNNQPNGFSQRSDLWWITAIPAGAAILTYLLLQNIHKIDPKRANSVPSATFNRLSVGLVLFLTVINIVVLMASAGRIHNITQVLLPLVGLLLAFVGNFMHSLKPNYFAGIRIPWTLASDDNWKYTHQLAGKIWFAGGLLIALLGFLVPGKAFELIFLVLIALMVLLPVLCSYRYYVKTKNKAA